MKTHIRISIATIFVLIQFVGLSAFAQSSNIWYTEVVPSNSHIAINQQMQLSNIAYYYNGTSSDVTEYTTWTTSNSNIASISNDSGTSGLVTGISTGDVLIYSNYAGFSTGTGLVVEETTIDSIQVTPADEIRLINETVSYTATAFYSDGSTTDITEDVIWSTDDDTVATIDENGLAITHSGGQTMIQADYGQLQANAALTVENQEIHFIKMYPSQIELEEGETTQITVLARLTDGTDIDVTTDVSWSVNSPSTASIDENGLATGLAEGYTPIEARHKSFYAEGAIRVINYQVESLELIPQNPKLSLGDSVNLTAIAHLIDGGTADVTQKATWNSSNTAVVEMNTAPGQTGNAIGNALGNAIITAQYKNFDARTTVSVIDEQIVQLEIFPLNPYIDVGDTTQFAAIGTRENGDIVDLTETVSWGSADPTNSSISDLPGTKGLATGHQANSSALIFAQFGSFEASTLLHVKDLKVVALTVTPNLSTMPVGDTVQLNAIATLENGNTVNVNSYAVWTSSDENAATVSDEWDTAGIATFLQAGTVNITATYGTFSATGNFEIEELALDYLEIWPLEPSVSIGDQTQFIAIAHLLDGASIDVTEDCYWHSYEDPLADVSNEPGSKGLTTGNMVGAVRIYANLGSYEASTLIKVREYVITDLTIWPLEPTIPVGDTTQFVATGTLENGDTLDITKHVSWHSNNEAILQIDDSYEDGGFATGLAPGSATVTAAMGSYSASTTITVSDIGLASLEVWPLEPYVQPGDSTQFIATGHLLDGSTIDLTEKCTWRSAEPFQSSVSDEKGTKGLTTGHMPNTRVRIYAQFGTFEASTLFGVYDIDVAALDIVPASPSLSIGDSINMTAIATLHNGHTYDLSGRVTWVSSDESVATVADSFEEGGLTEALQAGTTVVSAHFGSFSAQTDIKVLASPIESLEITPSSASINITENIQLNLIGHLTNGSTVDLTDDCSWTSQLPQVATVSDAVGSKGVVRGVGIGHVHIQAQLGSLSTQTVVTVQANNIVAINITPASPILAPGDTLALQATAQLVDGTTIDVSDLAVWSSNNEQVATVTNPGDLSALTQGTATIQANVGGIIGSQTVAVLAAPMWYLTISPYTYYLGIGKTVQFTATLTLTDNTQLDVTDVVQWTTNAPTVISVDQSGVATGLAPGAANIHAQMSDWLTASNVIVSWLF